MTREDIEQLHAAFDRVDTARADFVRAASVAAQYERRRQMTQHELEKADDSLRALCERLGVEVGDPEPCRVVPVPQIGAQR